MSQRVSCSNKFTCIAASMIILTIGSATDILSMAAVLCLTAMGYCLYLVKVLDQNSNNSSSSKIYNEIYEHVEDLQKIIEETSIRIKNCEDSLGSHFFENSKKSVSDLASLRRILGAIKTRRDEIIKLINSNKNKNLVEARQLIRQEIIIQEDIMNSVLDTRRIPPINPNILRSFIAEVMKRIEQDLEIKRTAELHR